MKRKCVLAILSIVTVFLTSCSFFPPNKTSDIADSLSEGNSGVVYDNQFARDLMNGRWSGELILDFYDGAIDHSLTKNFIYIKLDAEFNQMSNNLAELEMTGYMDFAYETPVVTLYPKGVRSVEFTPEKNHYVGPYKAKLSGVNGPEMYGQPAHLNFLNITPITGGVVVTITYATNPPFVQSHNHGPNEGAYFANDLYMLRQMSFITLEPDGDGRAVFGPHSHLRPSLTGIEDNIYGYLERVYTEEKTDPLKNGDKVETSKNKAMKAFIENQYLKWDLHVDPNTSIRYDAGDEDSITVFRGIIHNKVKNLSADHIMKVILPQAVAAVRGTDFSVNVIDKDKAIIKVYSGKVDVEISGEIYELVENQGIFIFNKEDKIDLFTFDGSIKPAWWSD